MAVEISIIKIPLIVFLLNLYLEIMAATPHFNNISIASQDDAIIDIINNFAVSSSGWTSEDINLEPRQKE